MARVESFSRVAEVVATIAVVVSLVYVGQEIRQNTAATQAASNQAAYEMHQARVALSIENPEFAELAIRVRDDVTAISAADSLRWMQWVNLEANVYEMVFSHAESGAMASAMAESWLAGLPSWSCTPLARHWWETYRSEYTPTFADRVDAAIASQPVCD